jgi:hypothetical protein
MSKVKSLKSASLREHNFLCAFILSDKFCSLFYKAFRPQYFENPDYKTLVAYIQMYYEKYNRPPKKMIISYIDKHKSKFQDTQLYESLKKTLIVSAESMDDLLEKYDNQYIIDDAELFIKSAAIRLVCEDIAAAFDNGDEENGVSLFRSLILPEIGFKDVIVFEDDLQTQKDVLGFNQDFLLQFKDQVGQLVGPLYRGDFFTWVAPTGGGKSWYLLWSAKQCRDKGLNVLFLSLEMQKRSVVRRFQQLYYRRTLYGEDVKISKFIKDDDKYKIIEKKINATKLEPGDVDHLKIKAIGKHPHGRLMIDCQAAINIGEVKAILSGLKFESNFVPDVICLDYADKMTTNRRVSNEREALGIIWKELRDLALDQNILIITASQTNRAAWDKHFTRDSIAEDSRKLNEVTGAIGIMANQREHELSLSRLRSLKTRDGWFEHRDVYCSQSFHIGQPVLQSVWANELMIDNALKESEKDLSGADHRKAFRRGRRGSRK